MPNWPDLHLDESSGQQIPDLQGGSTEVPILTSQLPGPEHNITSDTYSIY